MAQVAANILAGPARVFIGTYGVAVLPVTGAPPTLFQHSGGVPSGLQTGFTEVGYTTGAATFDYKAAKTEIGAEQSLLPVDVFVAEEMAQISFTAQERVYVMLKAAFDNIGSQTDATGQLYYAGNGTSILTPSTLCVFLSHMHRENVAKFSWACIYKTYSVDGVKMAFDKTRVTSYQVTLKALADTTRTIGDQAFSLKNEA